MTIQSITLVFEEEGAYTISSSIQPADGGSITELRSSANEDDDIAFTVTPATGYDIASVVVTDDNNSQVDVAYNEADGKYHFIMPGSNVSVTATFVLTWNAVGYTVSPENTGSVWMIAGTTVKEGVSKSQMGTSVTVKVVPGSGYAINTVTATDANGNPVALTVGDTNGDHNGWGTYYTFTMPSSAVTINATFKQGDLYILGDANGNSWAGNVGVKMDYDSANEKYTKDVYFANDTYGYFSFTEHLGNADYSNMGTRYGASNNNQQISSGQFNLYEGQNSFKIPAGIYTIEVNKNKTKVTITPKEITVTLTPNGGQVEQGTDVTVTSNLTALLQAINSGLSATLSTSTDGATYTEGNSYTFGSTGTTTVYGKASYGAIVQTANAEFTVVKHYNVTCTASPTAGGTVTANPESAQQGETVTLTITTREGYELTSVTVNGDEITATDGIYSFAMPAQNAAIVANFTPINYNINVVKSNCEVEVTSPAAYNSQVTFTITPRSDKYEVSSVSVTYGENGTKPVTKNNDGTYSFYMPASDVTLTVVCTRKSTGNQFTLVKSQDDIKAGGEYVILNSLGTQAMSKKSGNYETISTQFTLNDEVVTLSNNSDVSIMRLATGSTDGTFTMQDGTDYVQKPSGSGNSITAGNTAANWSILYSNGAFTLSSNNLYLRNNASHFRAYTDSNVGNALKLYKRVQTTAEVTIDPESGSVIGSQEVVVDATTETAVVRYQVNNGDWSEWATGPVNFTLTGNVGDIKVVTAQAKEPNQELEEGEEEEIDEASATYTFVAPVAPSITPATCHITDIKQSVAITSSYADGMIEYSTDGGATWETYSGKFNVEVEAFGQSVTVQARVTVNGVTSDVASATYTRDIQPVVFSPASGTYRGDQTCQIFSITKGARIYYTTDGSDPVMNQGTTKLYTGEIAMRATGTYTFKAVAYIGTTASTVTSAEYTIENKYASGNYLYSVKDLNTHELSDDNWTMVNPVQVIYMSSYQNGGTYPEYCLVRDNTGYGMIYFGKKNGNHTYCTQFAMGDWIGGGYYGPITNFYDYTAQTLSDTHPELGKSGTTARYIYNWPSSSLSNSAVLPEYLDIPTILASDPTDPSKDYWGHYVHLRKNTVQLIASTSDGALESGTDKDGKWRGIITDENGNQIQYYDKFYLQYGKGWTTTDNDFIGHPNRTYDIYGFVTCYLPDEIDYQISPFAFAWIDQPTCSHATGEYTSAQQVTLASDEDPEATIWYKTSDMDDYAIYHRGESIAVNSTTTIEWYATKMSDFNDELESKRGSVTLTFVEIARPVITPESVVKTVGESVDATIAYEEGKTVPADAAIIYTTDGSDPKTSETAQTYVAGETELHFTTTTTVRAITRAGDLYSAEAEPRTYSFVKSNGVVYELVTDVNQLTENGVYLIVSQNYGEALSTTQNTANRGAAGVMFVDDTKQKVYGNSDVALFQLTSLTHGEDLGSERHFLFHTGNGADEAANGYLYVGHENDNTLLTEAEEDQLGNSVMVVTIDADRRAHLRMNYSGGSNRYIQYWNRDRYFTTYKTEDDDRAVYIYGTTATPLAVIEQSGTQGKSYTVADDLQVVWVNTSNSLAWARDLDDNIDAVTIPTMGDNEYDYLRNAGQQTGAWQQNNWVMLDFSQANTNEFAKLGAVIAETPKHMIIKGGTLSGVYSDNRNYTIKVSGDAVLSVEEPEANYVPNVYCAANYGADAEGWQQEMAGGMGRSYWFMTPKVMEVATHTWSVWNGDGFYVAARDMATHSNEAGLVGAFSADWRYNAGQFAPTTGEAYKFLGVVMLKDEPQQSAGQPRHVAVQDGSTPNTKYVVGPLDLTGSKEQIVTAVSQLTAGREVVSVTYCDVAGRMSAKPFEGVNIVVTRYSDGTVTTGKAVY